MYSNGVNLLIEAVKQRGIDGDYSDLGDIRTAVNGNMILFNYTQKAQYSGRWNAVERAARGLIINVDTLEVVALPFEKFFNLSELGENPHLPDGDFEVTKKLDGSLGILYRKGRSFGIATRGSFTSDQALWATQFCDQYFVGLYRMSNAITLFFEIIYPENRIVVDYGDARALVIIGARNRITGYDYNYEDLKLLSGTTGIPLVDRVDFSDIREIERAAKTEKGVEGWVIRWNNGFRVKVKTDEYFQLHKVLTGLNDEVIRESMLAGTVKQLLEVIPEEFRAEVESKVMRISDEVGLRLNEICYRFDLINEQIGLSGTQKDFALQVIKRYPNQQAYLFSLRKGVSVEGVCNMILKDLDLGFLK